MFAGAAEAHQLALYIIRINPSSSQAAYCAADNLQMSTISSISSSAILPSAQNSGLEAIAAGNQRLSQDAQQVANPDSQNLTAPLVDLNQALVLAQAGANVISTENKMLGTLLDALA